MKKLLTYIPYACFIMVLGAIGAFFARTRETYVGNLNYHADTAHGKHGSSAPLTKVTVHLYDAEELRQWSNGDLLKSFLKWKSPTKERELLDELLDIYQGLETVYQTDSDTTLIDGHRARSIRLGKYSVQLGDPLLSSQAQFPWKTVKELRDSIPESLYHPALSLMSHKKDGMEEPITENFFQFFADTFQYVSPFPRPDKLIPIHYKIQEKIRQAEPGDLLSYKPRYDEQEATGIIHQFYRVDKLAYILQQYAVNDDEIVGLAPKPLLKDISDKYGKVDFDIPRLFAKKFKDKTEFAVVALSMDQGVHPGQAFAWLKYIYLNQEVILPEQRLPFFPPKQQFIFSNRNAVAALEDRIQPQESLDPSAPLQPLKFNRKPARENLFNALALLFSHKHDYLHGHGHDDGHSGSVHVGASHHTPQHDGGLASAHHVSMLPSANFDLFDEQILEAGEPIPVEIDDKNFELFDDLTSPEEDEIIPAPVGVPNHPNPRDGEEGENSAGININSPLNKGEEANPGDGNTADYALLGKTIIGSWYSPSQQRSYRFTPAGFFIMTLDQEKILEGFYRIPEDSPRPVLELTNKSSDGIIYHALFKFHTKDRLQIELGQPNSAPPETFTDLGAVFQRTQ